MIYYFFTFTCDLGMEGARIATALGATASLINMMVHFLKKSNTLRFSFKKTISIIFYRLLKVDTQWLLLILLWVY